MGLLGNVNDFHVLKKFGLYRRTLHEGLFDMITRSYDGVAPYLLGDRVTLYFLGL